MNTTHERSEAEYLVHEPEAGYKSEFRNGRVVAMAGAGRAHSLIAINLTREVSSALRSGPCEAYGSDTRVKVERARFYTYPDLSVVCDQPVFDRVDQHALVNPTVIFEILSPGTEAYDRGEKFAYYKKLDSLKEYVLIAQDRPLVERFALGQSGEWTSTPYKALDDVITLPSIGCRVTTRDLYEKVRLGGGSS